MPDFCELLHSEPLDRDRALWFVSDVIDQDAVERVNGCNAVCLPTGAAWDELDSKDVAGFPAIVIASTDAKWRREAIEELGSIARGVPLIEIRDGFKGHGNIAGFARKYGAEGLGDLLREGKESITRIAEACGFSSGYHFCRAFRDATGDSPTEYRRSQSF